MTVVIFRYRLGLGALQTENLRKERSWCSINVSRLVGFCGADSAVHSGNQETVEVTDQGENQNPTIADRNNAE